MESINRVWWWLRKWLDYAYFKDNYKLIAVDLSKQTALDADPRAIQQTAFQGVVGGNDGTKTRLYTILEQSKETVLEFKNARWKWFATWIDIDNKTKSKANKRI